MTSLLSLPWHIRKLARAYPWALGIATGLIYMLMLASDPPILSLLAGMVTGAISICCLMLSYPSPLTAEEATRIAGWLEKDPQWQQVVARWMSQGALDHRHYMSLSSARIKAEDWHTQQKAVADITEVESCLRAVGDGSLGAQVDHLKMNKSTAPAPAASVRPERL